MNLRTFYKNLLLIMYVILFFIPFQACFSQGSLTQEALQTADIVKNALKYGPHPRLHLNRDLLNQIKDLKDSNDPLWKLFYNWVKNKPTYSDMSGGVLTSYLLAYLVTGESQYFDWAWDLMKTRIYKNGVDRSGGFNTLIDLYKENHSAAFKGGQLIAQMAMLYDWGYDQSNPTQKKDLIDWLNGANRYNYLHNSVAKLYFRNDGAISTYGLAAGVYATLGENAEAQTQLKWFQNKWQEHMKTMDIVGNGGAMAEGNAYGGGTAYTLSLTANLVYYASGNDLFLSHPWFKQRLVYDAFSAYPGTIGGPDSPILYGWPGVMKEQASLGGDGRRGYSFAQLPLRPNGLILSRHFAGTEEATIWNWVYRQPEVDNVSASNSFLDIMFYSPKPMLIKPTKLSHFDPSLGYVYIRSDWDSDDATWISFWAGPHLDTHQHLDQGGFTIFKHRDLAPKTGHYDKDNVFSEHHLSYYTRTISSNGILVGDPYEIYKNFIAGYGCNKNGKGTALIPPDNSERVCIPNDGGQRTMEPFSLAVNTAKKFYAKQDVFDVAKVTFFEDKGGYVSLAADITNAYNNPRYSTPGNKPKVNRVYRWLVYLRSLDVIVIGDIVESTDPGFEKKWLLHSLDQLQIGGDIETIQPGEEIHTNVNEARIVVDDTQPSDRDQSTVDMRKGYAALLVKTLFPNQFRYRKVGGREPAETVHRDVYKPDSSGYNKNHFHRHINDFWVKDFSEGIIPNHKSFNWIPEFPNETATSAYATIFRGGYGRWRLEVEPAVPETTDYFLNVLKPTVDPHERLPLMEKIDTSDVFGTMILANNKLYTVIFQKGEGNIQPPIVRAERIPD